MGAGAGAPVWSSPQATTANMMIAENTRATGLMCASPSPPYMIVEPSPPLPAPADSLPWAPFYHCGATATGRHDDAVSRDGAADGRTAPAGLRHPPRRTGLATFTASGSPSDESDPWVGNICFSAIFVGFIHPFSGVVRFVPHSSDCPPSPCGRLSRPRTTTRALPHVRHWPKAGLLRCRRAGRASQVRLGCVFAPS